MKKKNNQVGGMALFNGLLLKSKYRECVVKEGNDITIEEYTPDEKFSIRKLPIIRGLLNIINIITSSIPHIIKSTEEILNDMNDDDDEEVKASNKMIVTIYIVVMMLLLLMYIFVPNLISLLFPSYLQNIVSASLQLIFFIIYLLILKNYKELNTMFEYHGAEHKVVNAYENFKTSSLSVEDVKKSSRFHRRCGGNFVVYLVLYIIILTIFIPSTNIWLKSIIQILALPILIGLACETLTIFSLLPKKLAFLSYPAMAIQLVTTIEPSEDKIKLAILALKGCVLENKKLTLKEYINKYVKENLDKIEYDISDILRIIAHYKNTTKDNLYINLDTISINLKDQIVIESLLNKLYKENIPLQYITNSQFFYNEEYFVNENVLIPRQDTEILVEKAIWYITNENLTTLIDMCTGSGCVGISIAKNTDIKIAFLVDISKKALDVANKNIELNDVFNKVKTIHSDLFNVFLDKAENTYDIIVSNPPYIPTNDILSLDENVKKEPFIALNGGKDGMDVYRKIFTQAKKVLKNNEILLLEIGYDELAKITELIKNDDNYILVESVKDLGGNDRVVVCRFLQK